MLPYITTTMVHSVLVLGSPAVRASCSNSGRSRKPVAKDAGAGDEVRAFSAQSKRIPGSVLAAAWMTALLKPKAKRSHGVILRANNTRNIATLPIMRQARQ